MKERTTQAVPVKATHWLAGILGLAFVLRLATVLWLSDTVPFSDAAYYHLAAQRMAADWTFPFDRSQVEYYGKLGWWPPLYPAFISVLYRLFGVEHRAVVFMQVGLGTLLVLLVHRYGKRIAGPEVGLTAAFLVAVDPTYVFLTNILASENLYVVWMVLGLLFAVDYTASRRRACLAGAMFGLGALTRAIGLVVPWVVALAARRRLERRVWIVASACLLGGTAAVVAPWTLRNALVAGSPALVCFGGGLNFYFGHNPQQVGYRDLSQTPMSQLTTQAAIDREGYRQGFETLRRDPFGFFGRGAAKIAALFGSPGYAPHSNSAIMLPDGWTTDPEKGRIAAELRARQRAKNVYLDGVFTHLATLHSWILVLGALAAGARWRRLTSGLQLCAWIALAWVGAHVVFWAQPRFRYPMEIPLALLAAWTGVEAVRASKRAREPVRTRRAARAAAVLAVACLGCGAISGCAPDKVPPPALAPWVDAAQPFDDPIEVAAVNALGPRPPEYEASPLAPIRLGEFLLLSAGPRRSRATRARELLAAGSPADSLPPILESIRIDPSQATAYFEAGRICMARAATVRAQAFLSQGLRLEPGYAPAWAQMGTLYVYLEDLPHARTAFEYALQLDPKLPAVRGSLTALYETAGIAGRADSLLRKTPPPEQRTLRAYLDGWRARQRGDFDSARELMRIAGSDSNAAAVVLTDWGNAEAEAGQLGAASLAYRRALRAEPGLVAARFGYAIVQHQQGDLQGAIESFGRVVRIQPGFVPAHFALASACLQEARGAIRGTRTDSLLTVADASFTASEGFGFHPAESRLRLAEVRLLRGDAGAAYTMAARLVADSSLADEARMLAGRAALAAERPQDAVAVLAPAFQADSLSVEGLALLGDAYLRLELPAYAASALYRAHERRPDDWRVGVNLAIAWAENDDFDRAEKLLREVVQRFPNEPYALQNLAAVLQRLGHREEAERLLQRVNELRER